MGPDTVEGQAAERGQLTRAVEVVVDPSPSQQRWLRSYVGSMRVVYNSALEQVADNLQVRSDERARGVPEDELTPTLVYHCTSCGLVLDRDVNAARNIRAEGQRPMRERQHDVASIPEDTRNGEPRSGETEPAQNHRAG